MASVHFNSILKGCFYNIKHVTYTCVAFGKALAPQYDNFFWTTFGLTHCIILIALGVARKRFPLPQEDPVSEDEVSSDGYDGDDDTDPDHFDENGDFEIYETVDFDLLDEDDQKRFILARWGSNIPMSPETARFFDVPPRRTRNLPGRATHLDRSEASGNIYDDSERIMDAESVTSPITHQVRDHPLEPSSGDHESQNATPHRVQSGDAAEPDVIDQLQNKLRDLLNTPSELPGEAEINDHNDEVGHASESETDRTATTSLVPFTASTDSNDIDTYKEDELEELIDSVKEASKSDAFRLKQDGFRTRYSIRVPKSTSNNTSSLEPREESSLRPEPLLVRNNTQSSENATGEQMDLKAFLALDEEEIWRDKVAEQAAIAEASYTTPVKTRGRAIISSPLTPLKHIASSTFSKGSKTTTNEDKGDKGVSPIISKLISRKTSSTKLDDRNATTQSGSDTSPLVSPPLGSRARATTLDAANELEFKAIPYDTGYTLVHSNEPSIVPPPKSARRKPLLSVNTENANVGAVNPLWDSPAVAGSTVDVSSSIDTGFDKYFHNAGEEPKGQPSGLMTQSPESSIGQDFGKGKAKRSYSKENNSSIYSPDPAKVKPERFTNDSPEVKLIERFHLKENIGVTSTKQLLGEEVKKASGIKGFLSKLRSVPTSTTPSQPRTKDGATDKHLVPFKDDEATAGSYDICDKAPVESAHDSLMSSSSTKGGPAYSSGSGIYSGSVQNFGEPVYSVTDIISPVTSDVGVSKHIARKAVRSGNAKVGVSSEAASNAAPSSFGGSGGHRTTSGSISNSYGDANVNPGYGKQEGANTATPFGSKTSSFSETIATPASGTLERTSVTETPRESNASSFSAVAKDVVHGAGGEQGNAGTPCNRFKLEEESAEKVEDRKMAKEDIVAHKVKELRKATGTEVTSYSTSDLRPAHPNHNLTFYQKNLICGKCHDNCAICGAPCCAFKGAMQTAVKDKGTEEGKAAAALARSITKWVSDGRDEDTFLNCTECYGRVCPACIGLCPVFPCHDAVCTKCNPGHLWEPCGWHLVEDVRISEALKGGNGDAL